jgi:hypothetical protein
MPIFPPFDTFRKTIISIKPSDGERYDRLIDIRSNDDRILVRGRASRTCSDSAISISVDKNVYIYRLDTGAIYDMQHPRVNAELKGKLAARVNTARIAWYCRDFITPADASVK